MRVVSFPRAAWECRGDAPRHDWHRYVAEIITAMAYAGLLCLYRWRGVAAFPRGAWERGEDLHHALLE